MAEPLSKSLVIECRGVESASIVPDRYGILC